MFTRRKIFVALFSVVTFISLIGLAAPVSAASASGFWTSHIQWDANGVSETGSVNRGAMTFFTLSVMRANGDTIGTKTVRIAKDHSDVHIAWGQPALDKEERRVLSRFLMCR